MRSSDYDAVISDIKMPGMDGLTLLRQVRAVKPSIPVMLVTGHGDRDLGVEALRAGAYCFVQKPLDFDFFIEWLKRAMHERQLSREVEEKTRLLERHARDLERRVAERTEALRQSEERLRLLLETTRMIPWEADAASWRFTYVGPQAVTLLGHALESWYEQDFWVRHIHPDDRDAAVSYCLKASQERLFYDFEYRMLAADGRVVWIQDVVTVVRDGERVTGLRGFMLDVTARKEAEDGIRRLNAELERRVEERTARLEAANQSLEQEVEERKRVEAKLRQSEQHLSEAQRLARLGSWTWDVKANKVVWSDELCEVYGIRPEDFGGTYEAFLERTHPDDLEATVAVAKQALADRQPFTYFHRIIRGDRAVRVLHSRGKVVTDADGTIVRMYGACQDVTELKEAEEALRRANEELQAQMSERV
ncbi:PAS domain-containing protein [Candidatus Nitrospira bockiana]